MKRGFAVTAALVLLGLSVAASADVFNLSPGLTNLETVVVGDPGNAADTRYSTPGYGAAAYSYNIGKYEVSAAQYCDFLNQVARTDTHGLYNANMWSSSYGCKIERTGSSGNYSYRVADDWGNRPVNYVSYWDACRFANWLHNGQPTGAQDASTTERGAYTLDGYNGTDGRTIERSANWTWAVTSEDEWYKSAYYKGGGADAGYWDYPMQSNIPTTPSNDITNPDAGNNANFYQNGQTIDSPYYRTNAGEFENSESAFGTFDQGGNVWEWNEAVPYISGTSAYRGQRGGSFGYNASNLQASTRNYMTPTSENNSTGFRVSLVPEPSSVIAVVGGLITIFGMRRRRA